MLEALEVSVAGGVEAVEVSVLEAVPVWVVPFGFISTITVRVAVPVFPAWSVAEKVRM